MRDRTRDFTECCTQLEKENKHQPSSIEKTSLKQDDENEKSIWFREARSLNQVLVNLTAACHSKETDAALSKEARLHAALMACLGRLSVLERRFTATLPKGITLNSIMEGSAFSEITAMHRHQASIVVYLQQNMQKVSRTHEQWLESERQRRERIALPSVNIEMSEEETSLRKRLSESSQNATPVQTVTWQQQQQQQETPKSGSLSQSQLMEENQLLLATLAGQMDTLSGTERRVHDISALSAQLAYHASEQSTKITRLYDDAVQQVDTVSRAEKSLRDAEKRTGQVRLWIVLSIVIAALILLFLDWFQ